jgi:DNA-binding FrmR family transcriptional regulator
VVYNAPMTKTTELGQDTVENILKRLRRIEGQVRGLQKMVAEGRPCDEVLTQMTATKKAMEAAATLILHEFLNVCATEVSEGKVDPKKPEEIANMLKKFI